MKIKTISLLLTVLLLSTASQAQNRRKHLNVEQIKSQTTSIFSNKDDWAEVTVQCKSEYSLSFRMPGETLVDKTSTPMTVLELDQTKKKTTAIYVKQKKSYDYTEYTFWLRAGEKLKRKNRQLLITASSPDFKQELYIPLDMLSPKARARYRIFNPYDAEDGTVFQEHHVRGMEFFDDCNYTAARQEFMLATYCEATPAEKNQLRQKIADCDSITYFTTLAEDCITKEQWSDACTYIRKAGLINPYDKYLINRFNYCNKKQHFSSAIIFQDAEDLFEQGNYIAAKELYEKVAVMHAAESAEALKRSAECDRMHRKTSNVERYLGIELAGGTLSSFGITKASYGNKKVGSYLSIRTNSPILKLMRQEYYIDDYARFDFTPLGVTIPVYTRKATYFRGVWLHGGAGVTLVNKFKYKSEASDNLKLGINYAVTPEFGVFCKVWRVGARLTYRHNISISDGLSDILGKNQISFGLGYCF